MWFEFNIPLLIFGLNRLSLVENGVLVSHTIIALLLLFAFKSFNIYLICLWPFMLDIYIYIYIVFYFDELTLYHYILILLPFIYHINIDMLFSP